MQQKVTYSQRILGRGKGIVAWQRLSRFRQSASAIRLFAKTHSLETIIDLGAADGLGLPFLSPLAKRVISLNRYHNHSIEFKSNYPKEIVVTTDGRQLPFMNGCVDAIVSLEMLHLLPNYINRNQCLNEICRILKPNGLFVCSVAIEVGIPALFKYFLRKSNKIELKGMTFGMMLKHCFYHFFDISKYDKGCQVGFNAYRFAKNVSEHFIILEQIYIPLPFPFCSNLMLVCKKRSDLYEDGIKPSLL